MASEYVFDAAGRLMKQTGATREEAERLLLRADGDLKRAFKLYAEAHSAAAVEPVKVEDAPVSAFRRAVWAAERLARRTWEKVLRFITGGAGMAAAILLALLAPAAAPVVLIVLAVRRFARAGAAAA